MACVSLRSAELAHARGYLGPGPCAGGVQPVVKRVVAIAGDVVEIEARVKRLRSRMGQLDGCARVSGRIVISGTMTFALGPGPGAITQ